MDHVISGIGTMHQTRPSARKLREFGVLVGSVLIVFGSLLRRRTDSTFCLIIGAALVAMALVRPAALHYLYRGWMKLADAISAVTTPLVLGIIFFGVIMPIGIIRRLMGKDELLRFSRTDPTFWDSYWPRQQQRDHYKKMY